MGLIPFLSPISIVQQIMENVQSDLSDEESPQPTESSSNNSVYLTPSMSGVEIGSKDPMIRSEFTVIESDDVKESSESSDDTADTDELPELVKIEETEQKTEETPTEEPEEPQPEVSPWDDVLGTGRLHIRRITEGEEPKLVRSSLVNVEILTPEAPFSVNFGTPECSLKSHSKMEITMSDHIDPAPGAVELSLHGMGVGGEVAVRAHKDLRGHLPDEFQIRVLSVEKDELKQANDSKQKGNELYKEVNFEKASKYYERGVSYLNEYYTENEVSDESKDIWIKLKKNLGRCYFKLGQNVKSLETFDEILAVDSKNQDVLMLKVEVLSKEKRLDDLLKTCQAILALSPSDSVQSKMKQRIETIQKFKKAQDEKYKKMCQKMTGTFDRPTSAIPVSAKPTANEKPEKISQSDSVNHMLIIGAVAAAGLAAVAFYVLSKK